MTCESDPTFFYDRLAARSPWDEATNPDETRRRLHLVFEELLAGTDLLGLELLDAGSGGGHFAAEACRRGARVTAVDVGENLLAQVAERCEARCVTGNVLALPFGAGRFDVVLSTEVIEHTPEPRRALMELARVVRPGGRLLVTSPCRLWQPVVRFATRVGLRPYAGHENFLWPKTALRVLQKAGIEVRGCRGFNLVPVGFGRLELWHRRWDRLGGVVPWLFVNYFVDGRKRR